MIIEIGENLAQILFLFILAYLFRAIIYAWAYRETEKEE